MTPKERLQTIERLVERLLEEPLEQPIEHQEARKIVETIGTDDDVLEIARTWLETGRWPDEPEMEGLFTPASLGRRHRPTYVLTALLWLKREPLTARESLLHAAPDPAVPFETDLVADVSRLTDDELAAMRERASKRRQRRQREPRAPP